ncbi:MAG: hypothetical protein O7F17_03985 [Planctomycetota bacterium]|nr:hypothetical protein [Planctomycetota bacterium]
MTSKRFGPKTFGSSTQSGQRDQFTTRIDFVESDNSQWFGRFVS